MSQLPGVDGESKTVLPLPPVQVQRIETLLSHILRGGVTISAAIVLLGVVLMFAHHPEYFSHGTTADAVVGDLAFPHSLGAIVQGLGEGQGRSVIIAGLLVLIATPVIRVAASVVIFAHHGDRLFVVITLLVLVLLLTSFFLGRAG